MPSSARLERPDNAAQSNTLEEMPHLGCERCGALLDVGGYYVFQEESRLCRRCLRCGLMYGPALQRAAIVALVVGSCLTLINQGDVMFQSRFTSALLWKIPLSYVVPFLVSTYSTLAAARSRR